MLHKKAFWLAVALGCSAACSISVPQIAAAAVNDPLAGLTSQLLATAQAAEAKAVAAGQTGKVVEDAVADAVEAKVTALLAGGASGADVQAALNSAKSSTGASTALVRGFGTAQSDLQATLTRSTQPGSVNQGNYYNRSNSNPKPPSPPPSIPAYR